MRLISDYRGYNIRIAAVPVGKRFNAVVSIRAHFPLDVKPREETVRCLKLDGKLAEHAAEIVAKRLIDVLLDTP